MPRNSQEAHRRAEFKRNLDQRMGERKLTREKLAELMRLDRDGRKWLTRVCRDGLARPNPATIVWLGQLARHLGLLVSEELWDAPEHEPMILAEMRLVLADLAVVKEDELGDVEKLTEEMVSKIEQWRKAAAEVRRFYEYKIKLDAVVKLKSTASWNRICALIAKQKKLSAEEASKKLFDQAMRVGVDSVKEWIEKKLAEQAKTKEATATQTEKVTVETKPDITAADLLKEFQRDYPTEFENAVDKLGTAPLLDLLKQVLESGTDPDQLVFGIAKQFRD